MQSYVFIQFFSVYCKYHKNYIRSLMYFFHLFIIHTICSISLQTFISILSHISSCFSDKKSLYSSSYRCEQCTARISSKVKPERKANSKITRSWTDLSCFLYWLPLVISRSFLMMTWLELISKCFFVIGHQLIFIKLLYLLHYAFVNGVNHVNYFKAAFFYVFE